MRFIGVELDGISGRIARALHPGHDIRIENFRDTKLPEGRLDAVIGNVPFADVQARLPRPEAAAARFLLRQVARRPEARRRPGPGHQPFHARQAERRHPRVPGRPGRLPGRDPPALRRLQARGHARRHRHRVPAQARPRRAGPATPTRPGWTPRRSPSTAPTIPINRYFLQPPRDGAGHLEPQGPALRRDGYSVIGNGDLAAQLGAAIARLARGVAPPPAADGQDRARRLPSRPPPPERHITEGSFFVGDDRTIRQVEDGQAVPVTYGGTLLKADGTMTGKRLAALIGLRDHARRVLQSQNEGWPEANRDDARRDAEPRLRPLRRRLRPDQQDDLQRNQPTARSIRRMPNLVKFREDPDAMLVMALEDYDEVTGKATKAADHAARTWSARRPPVTHVTTAEEGLLVSLDRTRQRRSALHRHALRQARGADHRRAGRPDLPRPGNEDLADRRRLPLGQRPREARRRRARRPGLRPQRRGPARRAARGRAARRHRRQPRRPVDTRSRHPGVRRRPVRRRPVRHRRSAT